MFPDFEDVAFGLDTLGQVSQPLATPYGWHIIRLDQKSPVGSFEESREWLESMIRRDARSQIANTQFINKLKQENNWVRYHYADSLLAIWKEQSPSSSEWLNGNSNPDTLFTIRSRAYTTFDLIDYVKQNHPPEPDQS